ncbi:hypothetical protein [uncultured Victivallis sp.]|uniref:hypothetical protein n=1 Tax=uncultured Victivallis sp. TaxID=354118 RepID=UPI0025CBE08A|nr:hypothetical protein [uncultured Victivallis sp.]
MKILMNVLFGAMLLGAVAADADDIYDNLLETQSAVSKWRNAQLMTFLPNGAPESDESAVRLFVTDPAKGAMAQFPVDVNLVRGKTVKLTGKIKGENISVPPQAYLGVKMMFEIVGADGKKNYPDVQPKLTGTFGWREAITIATIPADAKAVTIVIGLQNSSGTIYFSDLELDEVK